MRAQGSASSEREGTTADALAVQSTLPDALLDAEVLDARGRASTLRRHAAGKTALFVFLRHFGCIGCSQQVDAIVPFLAELHALGVSVILVGNGEPRYIDGFVERQRLEGYPLILVTDPTLRSHDAAGFRRSRWATYGPRALWADLTAMARGYAGGAREGDAYQQGGVIVADAEGLVLFYQPSRSAAEPIPASVIMAAVLEHGSRTALRDRGFT